MEEALHLWSKERVESNNSPEANVEMIFLTERILPEELGLHQVEPHQWQKSLHLLAKTKKKFSVQLRSVQAVIWRTSCLSGPPSEAQDRRAIHTCEIILDTYVASDQYHLLLLPSDLVRTNDGGEVVTREVTQLITLKHLPWVCHNVQCV